MEPEIIILFIIVILLVSYRIYRYYIRYKYSVYVTSKIDNKDYLVRNSKNKEKAADVLAEINSKILLLLKHINASNIEKRFENNMKLLTERYNHSIIYENIYMDSTSYTINKSETLLCLATRDNEEKIYDINLLMFVTLHELAHIGNETYGHDESFVNFFIFLMKNAIQIGVYKYVNYSKEPKEYCGIEVNSSPI
jgi:hypothetical protein